MIPLFRISAALLLGTVLTPRADAGMEVIAHRGAMRLAPENTLASQRLAYELGADYVEVDVRLTADGVPINLHDHFLERTTTGTGLVASLTLAQLKQLDAGVKFSPRFAGERVPTIAENLEVAKQYNRKIMFDIKGEDMDGPLIEVIRQSGIALNQLAFLTYWDSMTAPYTTRLAGAKFLRAPVTPGGNTNMRAEDVTDGVLEYLRRQKVTTLIFGAGYVYKKDIDRFHDAGFEVSGLYHHESSSFIYQDLGLDSFWTDATDSTVGTLTRTEQKWNNWAEITGLAPDQRHTWMDPDNDGLNNLAEMAMGTDPLTPNSGPVLTATSPGKVGWNLDLRENWSELVTAEVQRSTGGNWTTIWGTPVNFTTPTHIQFQMPVTPGRQFFRMKFEMIR